MSHGVKRKISRFSDVLMQFSGKGNDDCIDVIIVMHEFEEANESKHVLICHDISRAL
jgi:hypothetical protein